MLNEDDHDLDYTCVLSDRFIEISLFKYRNDKNRILQNVEIRINSIKPLEMFSCAIYSLLIGNRKKSPNLKTFV